MITIKTITELQQAKQLWKQFSPNEEIYDDWNFRYIAWQFNKPEILFIAAYNQSQPIGLLPLQWNNDGYYEFFGGDFMSYNLIYDVTPDKSLTKILIESINKPMWLRWMREPVDHDHMTTSQKSTYFLPIDGMLNINDYYVTRLSKTRRKQIKKEINNINKENPTIELNNINDIYLLEEFNKERFKEKSLFHKPNRINFFLEVAKQFDSYIATLVMNDKKIGVGLRIAYNNKLYGLSTSYLEGTKNVGKYLYINAIEYAIIKGFEKYDALEGSYNWKEEFGFMSRPQYHLDLREI